MKVLKCKMCGGDIITNENQTYGTCDSCGTTSTLPKVDNEQIANLFNRANHFRRQNDFDKALSAYENILEIQSNNAEAYWGVVLSRFGIEYVDDVQTQTKIPTCHRVQTQSILSDSDYLQALNYSEDSYTRSLYEQEAQKIYEIQRGILEISKNENPYDVFICYKESTESGSRTIDSTIAQEIYYKLKDEGYNVFFSRITLEDKLGKEYEPYIFAALNSAKVMLVVGTKPEYFRSTWVKNEWMRYLSLMKKDKDKVLIPCYRDMNAYDIPDEMSMLQSQDMSKIGFIQDLIRGVQKVLMKKTNQFNQANTQTTSINKIELMIDTILKRVEIFIEYKEWDRALEYCEKALDIDATNAQVYTYKACITFRCQSEEDLSKQSSRNLKNDADYKKALRFSDSTLKDRLNRYIADAQKREEEERKRKEEEERKRKEEEERKRKEEEEERKRKEEEEEERKEEEERERRKNIGIAKKVVKFVSPVIAISVMVGIAINTFILKPNKYKDKYKEALNYIDENNFQKATEILTELGDYKDSENILNVTIPEEKYKDAVDLIESEDYRNAYELLKELGDYKDSVELKKSILIKRIKSIPTNISAGNGHTVGLKSDGTVVAVGDNSFGQIEVENWKDIVSISSGGGNTVGLKSDGTVVALGRNPYGQVEVEDWKDIVSISSGGSHTVGLKSDGTVVAVGDNSDGQCEVDDWKNIVAISAGEYHTVGLKSDGTVVAVGANRSSQIEVEDWKDIVSISAGGHHTVGLKSDGTVVAVGGNSYGQIAVEDWKDIVSISGGGYHTVGLKLDGTVVAVGFNCYKVENWRNIVSISAGECHTLGLKSDGAVVAQGENDYGQCEIESWSDIKVD